MKENSKFKEKIALAYDDVLLEPRYSEILLGAVDVSTYLTRNIRLNIPLVSAAMDTVTESALAIAIAREGGIGIIHRNLSVEDQAREVTKVKRSESGKITDPITIGPQKTLEEAQDLMKKHNIAGLPVIDRDRRLLGILTHRDIRSSSDLSQKVADQMTKDDLVTAPYEIDFDQAEEMLSQRRVEKLPLVDKEGKLVGLITFRDLRQRKLFPKASRDEYGRLRVGAAIGVLEKGLIRAEALIEAGVDVIVIDTANGYSFGVIETLKEFKKRYPRIEVIAGNVATKEGARALIEAGADAIKVNIGGGSICTTRIITGVGIPQLTAIMECAQATKEFSVPLIADGGIRSSGDVVKALAAGANSVMIGNLFAGTDESPGEVVTYQEGAKYKIYRGMGSLEVMKETSERGESRYQTEEELVPEGVEARVPYRGSLSKMIAQLVGGLRSGMASYCGVSNIEELQSKTHFVRITNAGYIESHPHNVIITKQPPNYWFGEGGER